MKNKIFKILICALFVVVLILIGANFAQALMPLIILNQPPTPSLKTLNDIYVRLTTNEAAGAHTLTPSVAASLTGSAMPDLDEIYNAIPTIDPTKVLQGTTYLGIAGTAAAPLVWGDDDSNTYTWDQAVAHCAAKTDGGYTWRLPTISELLKGISDQFILGSGSGFGNDTYYWSGTEGNSGYAWYTGFIGTISIDVDIKTDQVPVRCVH